MKFFIVLLFLLTYSCGYPDIDTVPKENKLNISESEAIDLCNSLNADNKDEKVIADCLNSIDIEK